MGEVELKPVEPLVRQEMQRIRALFVSSPDDKEDLITYAKEIVSLRQSLKDTPCVG
jgi:hypothetical protein